jgi:hypothetical protein
MLDFVPNHMGLGHPWVEDHPERFIRGTDEELARSPQNCTRVNAVPHDTLGMKPIDRFGIDLARVRFLTPSEHSDELFYAEATRKVKKDNTFSFAGRRYETPVDLHDREIHIRFDRQRHDTVVVYHQGQRLGTARFLDAVANGLQRRKEQP